MLLNGVGVGRQVPPQGRKVRASSPCITCQRATRERRGEGERRKQVNYPRVNFLLDKHAVPLGTLRYTYASARVEHSSLSRESREKPKIRRSDSKRAVLNLSISNAKLISRSENAASPQIMLRDLKANTIQFIGIGPNWMELDGFKERR